MLFKENLTTFFQCLVLFLSFPLTGFCQKEDGQGLLHNKPYNNFFIENKGQWSDEVRFLARIGGINAWITGNGVVYDIYTKEIYKDLKKKYNSAPQVNSLACSDTIYGKRKGHVVSMLFEGMNDRAIAEGKSVLTPRMNFFTDNRQAADVKLYQEAILHDIYPGIDQRWYFTASDELRYDFIVAPKAAPSDIKIKIKGADEIFIKDNTLVIHTSMGALTHAKLFVYQDLPKGRCSVKATWALCNDIVGFSIKEYNKDFPLIIDPLIYSTYIGSNNDDDYAYDMVTDSLGCMYITGITESSYYPVTTGAYSTVYGGSNYDMFVTKLNSSGSDLVFSTYIGGASEDQARGIAVDDSLNIYITGFALFGFPTTIGSFDPSFNGDYDAVLCKLSSDGSNLLFSTFIGSPGYDQGKGICINSQGNPVILGVTNSYEFPHTLGAFQDTVMGGTDLFICSFNKNGNPLLFSTFLGGVNIDYADNGAIAIDANDNIYVAGMTPSPDYPLTGGAYDNSLSGTFDVCVSKLNYNGTQLLASTLIGGSLTNEQAMDIAVDDSSNIYITGYTESTDFPVTPGAYDITHNSPGYWDVFVTKFNNTLSYLKFSTFLGGNEYDDVSRITLDVYGNIYLGGNTSSVDFPVTPNAFDNSYFNNGTVDAFVAKLSNNGASLLYSTFLGQNGDEFIEGISVDNFLDIYVAGDTYSGIFPTTPGAYDETKNGNNNDLFATKLRICTTFPTIIAAASPDTICDGESTTLVASGVTTFVWSHGLGNTATVTATPAVSTTYTVNGLDGVGCPGSAQVAVIVMPPPQITATADSSAICKGESTNLTASGGSTYQWSNGLGQAAVVTVTPLITTQYSVTGTDDHGCTNTADVIVTVRDLPIVTAVALPDTICSGENSQLTADGASDYIWNHGLGSNPVVTASPSITTVYTVTGTDNFGCSAAASVEVYITDITVIATALPDTLCSGETTTLAAQGGSIYQWSHSLGNGATVQASPVQTTTYTVVGWNDYNCTDTATIVVAISKPSVLINTLSDTVCLGNQTQLTATGALTYSWSNGLGSGTSVIITPVINGTYTVVGFDAYNCTDTAEQIITVITEALPITSVTATPDTICAGTSATLTASGNFEFVWASSLGSGSTIVVNPLITTTYTVTATNTVNGCYNTADAIITVHLLPTVSVIVTDDSLCIGESTILIANGADNYQWNQGLGSGDSLTVTPITTTTYTVTGTDTNGCESVAAITVFISPLPQATADNTGPFCTGDTIFINAQGGISYNWSGPQGFVGTNALASIPSANQAMSGIYTVTVTNSFGCTDTAQTQVAVNPPINALINATQAAVCPGSADTLIATGGTQYIWSTGHTAPSVIIMPQTAQWYYVTVSVGVCSDTASVYIDVHPQAVANAGNDTTVIEGTSFLLHGSGGANCNWMPATFLDDNTICSPLCTALQDIYYVLTVINQWGCTATDSIFVSISNNSEGELFIPNAFSPNADGNNDVFMMHGPVSSYSIMIFNQWGEKIYVSTENNPEWNGKYGDIESPAGVYAYIITYTLNNGNTLVAKGNVMLVR